MGSRGVSMYGVAWGQHACGVTWGSHGVTWGQHVWGHMGSRGVAWGRVGSHDDLHERQVRVATQKLRQHVVDGLPRAHTWVGF
eukprot:3424437-Prymnesium_polylepis.2